MSERMPPRESLPNHLDVRRDALLLRIVELREAVRATDFDQEIVSKELGELDTRVQKVEGLLDMEVFEQLFETLEGIVDAKR